VLREIFLGVRNELDHPLVRLTSRVTEAEHAVIHQHHSNRLVGALRRELTQTFLR
jgi:hypothetical protein